MLIENMPVVALQYYYIAQIVLLLSEQNAQRSGFARLREGRRTEVRASNRNSDPQE